MSDSTANALLAEDVACPASSEGPIRPATRRIKFGIRPWRWLLVVVFVSHFLVLFMRLTAGVIPTPLSALLPTLCVALLYGITFLEVLDSRFHVNVKVLDVVVFAFMMLALMQTLNDHVTITFGLRGWQRTAFFCGMYFVGRYLVTDNVRAFRVLRWSTITIALAGLLAILQSNFGFQLDTGYQNALLDLYGVNTAELAATRSYGTLVSQASFGVLTGMGVLMAFGLFASHRSLSNQLSALVCALACILGLLLSGTRSAILGTAIALLPLLYLVVAKPLLKAIVSARMHRRVLLIVGAAALLALSATILMTTSNSQTIVNVRKRMVTISPIALVRGSTVSELNVVSRMDIWLPIIQAIGERPLRGYGTGALGGGSDSVRENVKPVNGMTLADNQYLELWGELGVFSLVLYGIVLATVMARGFLWKVPLPLHATLMVGGCVAILFIISGSGNVPLDYYPANMIFWLLVGISANAPALLKDLGRESRKS